MTGFKTPQLKELTDQQVRFAPPGKRREQVANAERLLNEIDPNRTYPYPFVCFRLTDYRPDAHADLLIRGFDLKRDLALFIIKLERSIPPLPIEQAGQEMLTLDEVSQRFHVSTKTVGRWRLRGLVARRVRVNGRNQLGFARPHVEDFLTKYKDRLEKSTRFCHLSDEERDSIIATARNLAAGGVNLTDASRRIAAELGRSSETVRYTIKNFDKTHPDAALFPRITGPLPATAKDAIFDAVQEGKPMDFIAKRFNRTRSSMYRVANEVRAERLVREPLDYMYNEEFDDPAKEALLLGPMPGEVEFFEKIRAMRPPKDVDPQMAYLYEKPLLTREQEAHLFRKMNFLKHQYNKLRAKIDPARARVQELLDLERLNTDSKSVRDLLIECNQRLVHSLATKHLQPGQTLDELKSDANISVMRAVEKFDYGRGNKFSTYATWAIMKNFARSIPDEHTRRSRYVTGTDEVFDAKADVRTDEAEILAAATAAKNRVSELLEVLDPRTRDVIKMRTGLDGSAEMTLEQIGQHFGITKERVRQINVRGMKQLRERAQMESGELN
ncbi:MAG TPA: sigma-70 family RNA polymerase sigma factor [Fimbriiglobus sp.]